MRCNLVDLGSVDCLCTRHAAIHDVEEDESTAIVANHESVLLGLQPGKGRRAVVLGSLELEPVLDCAVPRCLWLHLSAVPEKDRAVSIQ